MSNLFRQNIYNIIKNNLPHHDIEIINNEDIDLINVIKLFFSDYVIFLTSKYFIFNFDLFCFKKNLLKYFEKYDVVYLNYSNKNKIINLINILNLFIKNSNDKVKTSFLNILIQESSFTNIIHKKIKEIYFNDNNIEPSILYKKILFSNQELFLPFNNYIIKKMEYKLRTFCQIAEKLGAEKIVIEYSNNVENKLKSDVSASIMINSIGGSINDNNKTNNSIKIVFEYPNNTYDINLNKYYIINLILNENDFMITKQEFEADLELKFLIDARCINLIQKYHTNFIINHMNSIEQKIFMKASKYGLDMGRSVINNESTKISILIDFLPLHNNYNMIDGTNVHVLREGFQYLSNIVKKEDNYNKLLGFLKSHLNAIEKKWIALPYEYDHIDIIGKIYNVIFNLNFKPNESEIVLRHYFENNLTWDAFEKFRDLILKGSDIRLDKLHYVTFQLYDILNFKKGIVDKINKYFQDEYINFLNKLKIKFENNNSSISNSQKNNQHSQQSSQQNQQTNNQTQEQDEDVVYLDDIETSDYYFDDSISFENYEKKTYKNSYDFFLQNKGKISGIIITAFKKSFYFKGGLSDNIYNIDTLVKKIRNIIFYYFDYEYKYLNQDFQSCVINKDNMSFIETIDKFINIIANKVILNINYKKNNTTPKLKNNNEEKISLLMRHKKIFINFLMKYNTIDKNNIHKLINTTHILTETQPQKIKKLLLKHIDKNIPITTVYKNYSKYKLFYTWENMNEISLFFQ